MIRQNKTNQPFSTSIHSLPPQTMVKMVYLFYLLLLITSSAEPQQPELLNLLPLQDPTDQTLSAAVRLPTEALENVSASVLFAESWLRDYVFPHYPSTNVTAILVGHSVFCAGDHRRRLGLVLPAIKNIHHSLTRWGLQNDIKPTTSFSSDCISFNSEARYREGDLAENYVKPLLTLLQEIGSPYVVNVNPPEKDSSFLKPHLESMRNLGDYQPGKVSMVISSPSPRKERMLSSVDPKNPLPPLVGTFSPAPEPNPKNPLPPLIGTISPEAHHRSPPFLPPMASPGFGQPRLPPCEPSRGVGQPPHGGHLHHGVWCVAKPSVPAETLQESLDFACGEGSADCEAINEGGSCYFPDSVVAHASYAFNSYWQKNKRTGGSCGFGGTAMLITSDPSYQQCKFILA